MRLFAPDGVSKNPDEQDLVALMRVAIARRCRGRVHVSAEEVDARARAAVWQLCDALDCRKPTTLELDRLVIAAVANLTERNLIEPFEGGFRRTSQ